MNLIEWWHHCHCCKHHFAWIIILFFLWVFDEDPEVKVSSIQSEEEIKPSKVTQTCLHNSQQPKTGNGHYDYFPYYRPRYRTEPSEKNNRTLLVPQYNNRQSQYGQYSPNTLPYGTLGPNKMVPNNHWRPAPNYPSPKYPQNERNTNR